MMLHPIQPIKPPPEMTAGEIVAAYWQMRNHGIGYIPRLGSVPQSIDEWRAQELAKRGITE